jgi:hypothetical protein
MSPASTAALLISPHRTFTWLNRAAPPQMWQHVSRHAVLLREELQNQGGQKPPQSNIRRLPLERAKTVRESDLPDSVQTKSKRNFRAAGRGRSLPLILVLERTRKRYSAHNWPQANATAWYRFPPPIQNAVLPCFDFFRHVWAHFISSGNRQFECVDNSTLIGSAMCCHVRLKGPTAML